MPTRIKTEEERREDTINPDELHHFYKKTEAIRKLKHLVHQTEKLFFIHHHGCLNSKDLDVGQQGNI